MLSNCKYVAVAWLYYINKKATANKKVYSLYQLVLSFFCVYVGNDVRVSYDPKMILCKKFNLLCDSAVVSAISSQDQGPMNCLDYCIVIEMKIIEVVKIRNDKTTSRFGKWTFVLAVVILVDVDLFYIDINARLITNVHCSSYTVWVKKVAPLKLFAVLSLLVNLCNWKLP